MSEGSVAQNKTNGMAVASLVLAFFVPIVGLILGIISLSKIKKSNETGKGLAIAGIVISVIVMLFQFIILLAIIGGTKAVIDSDTKGSTNTTSKSESKTYRFNDRADKQPTDVEVAVGESATVDGVKMTVSAINYKQSLSEFEEAGNGKTYAVVDVELENISDDTKPYNTFNYRVQTAGGQVLDATFSSSLEKPLDSGDLVAGGKVSGQVAIEVPEEEGHQYLIWKPGFASDRAIVEIK